jgi:hypothetical protein
MVFPTNVQVMEEQTETPNDVRSRRERTRNEELWADGGFHSMIQ